MIKKPKKNLKNNKVLYHLCQNSEVQRKLQEHVDEVFEGKESLDIEDFNKLTYVKYVIQETLRINPVIPFLSRLCAKVSETKEL